MRKFLRISLATLFLLLTILCIWLGLKSQHANRQQNVARIVGEAKGIVNYAHQANEWPLPHTEFSSQRTFDSTKTPTGPDWLRSRIGDDYFLRAVHVDLEDRKPSCHDLTLALAKTSDISWLNLAATDLSDSELPAISSMKQLTVLRVSRNPKLTDAGLAQLTSLSNLERLDAGSISTLTGSFLENANRMTKLRELDLQDTSFDGSYLRYLRGHPSIHRLTLPKTKIDNDDLHFLATMPELKLLSIDNTEVTENGIAFIAENLDLIHLYIGGDNVTDNWVPHLAKMKSLEYLAIWDTSLGDEAFVTLEKSIPNCHIRQ